MSSENVGQQMRGIKVEQVRAREYPGVTIHQGRVADGQTGYRMVKAEELEPQHLNEYGTASGYRSRGKFLAGPEKHSRGSTMFSATPLSPEDMDRYGATHQVEVDISGMPFRTLKRPEGDQVKADVGLGLGVVGEMKWDRIKRITTRDGQEYHPEPSMGTPGEAISLLDHMDSGYRTRGR